MSSSCSGVSGLASLPDRWKHGAVPVIGLTGAIGGGKSQVAALLGKRGAIVIDADLVGHEVLEHPEVRRRVIERFGPGVIAHGPDAATTGGPINRQALGSIVFAAKPALADLEAIVHPRMRQQFEAIIDRELARGGAPAVVLDAAILLEAGWDSLCDLVVFVTAAQPIRLDRVARGRGWTAEALQAREAAQWPLKRKLDRADIVIHNDSSFEILDQSVDRFFRLVTDRDSTRWRVSETAASSRLDGSAFGCSAAVTREPGDPRWRDS
jgi:dephospho-CoA kinase